ncbi:MAG: hypothetical protein AAFY47_00115 [Pseudomonadota bacterium]
MWISFLVPFLLGAGSAALGVAVQVVIARHKAAEAGHFGLGMILAIYIGARLTHSSLSELILECVFASVMLLVSLTSLRLMPKAVGVIIVLHGLYDQLFAHSAGLPDWYPPFCGGVDVVLGIGVMIFAPKRPTVLTH